MLMQGFVLCKQTCMELFAVIGMKIVHTDGVTGSIPVSSAAALGNQALTGLFLFLLPASVPCPQQSRCRHITKKDPVRNNSPHRTLFVQAPALLRYCSGEILNLTCALHPVRTSARPISRA